MLGYEVAPDHAVVEAKSRSKNASSLFSNTFKALEQRQESLGIGQGRNLVYDLECLYARQGPVKVCY
jgi:hypothetical protein